MRSWLFLVVAVMAVTAVSGDFKLLILHTNDMHARFEQTSRISSKCSSKDIAANNCYGGFARVAHVVNQAREDFRTGKGPPVLFLNAGDNFQGTIWYNVHKWNVVANLTSMLRFDAMALGNHEFDDGVPGLVPFIKNVDFPVIAANLNVTREPTLAATSLAKSVILNVANKKVGIIGYVTPETKDIALAGLVSFNNEIDSIKLEALKLKAEGVDILIALGHSGFAVDQKIAEEVPDIDVVVGGHTNTFLYTGTPPDPLETVQGLYPTMVRQRSGRQVPVVQAYAYTKYIGRLTVTFDNRGDVIHSAGNPLLLDNTIPQDKRILEVLDVWREDVLTQSRLKVGTTKVYMRGDGKFCRMGECNLGNFIADAMIDYFVRTNVKFEMGWSEAPLAILNGGSIRADIDISNEADNGGIAMADIMSTLPFGNSLVFVQIQGKHLWEAFEWSIARYDPRGMEPPGGFLQVSGIHVKYDICMPKDKRVVSLMVRCGDCRVPEYKDIELEKLYGVLMPTYLAQGGDGYNIKKHFLTDRILDTTDTGVLADYVKKLSPIYPGTEGRILFSNKPCSTSFVSNSAHSPRTQLSTINGCLGLLIAVIIITNLS